MEVCGSIQGVLRKRKVSKLNSRVDKTGKSWKKEMNLWTSYSNALINFILVDCGSPNMLGKQPGRVMHWGRAADHPDHWEQQQTNRQLRQNITLYRTALWQENIASSRHIFVWHFARGLLQIPTAASLTFPQPQGQNDQTVSLTFGLVRAADDWPF